MASCILWPEGEPIRARRCNNIVHKCWVMVTTGLAASIRGKRMRWLRPAQDGVLPYCQAKWAEHHLP